MLTLNFLRKLFCGPCTECLKKDTQITQMQANLDIASDTIFVLEDQMKGLNATAEVQAKRIDELLVQISNGSEEFGFLLDEINTLNTELEQYEPSFEITEYITVDGDWVKDVLKKYGVRMYRYPMDTEYHVPSLEDTAMILDWDLTDTFGYITNRRDCDKFARRIWSRVAWLFGLNHIGLINDTSAGHAYNVFLTSEGELWVHEPQQEIFWEYDNDVMEGIYDAEHGVILL